MKFRLIEIPRIECYADMKGRPAFRPVLTLPAGEVSGVTIVAPYGGGGFEDVQCGLASCRAHHKKGLLVRFPWGVETNVGHLCCDHKFGELWQVQKNLLDNLERLHAEVKQIHEALERRDEFTRRAEELLEAVKGARWVSKSKRLFERAYPRTLVEALKRRALRGESAVWRTRQRDEIDKFLEDQLEEQRALGARRTTHRMMHMQENVGSISGLNVWKGDPQRILEREVLGVLAELEAIEISDEPEMDSPATIRMFARRCAEIPRMLDTAEDRISAGRLFFTERNFRILPAVVSGTPAERQTRRIEWDFTLGGVLKSRTRHTGTQSPRSAETQ